MAKSFISEYQDQTRVNLIADSAKVQSGWSDPPSRAEARALMAESDTRDLVITAGLIRDRTRPEKFVTYSRKVFINLVNLCRDTCSYCTYKKEPGDQMASLSALPARLVPSGPGNISG